MRWRTRRASKARRWLEALLLLGGLTGVGIWGWSRIHMALFQQEANRLLERKLANRPAIPAPAPQPPPTLAKGALVGRLVIPRLKVQAVVREGTASDTLDVALGHIPGTALPGQSGNVGVAGHRDTLFRGLRNVAKNDVIRFETPDGNYNYHVESTQVVTPQDVGVLAPDGRPEITLVTCYPFNYVGSAPNRFIVKARLETPTVTAQVARPPVVTPAVVKPAVVKPAVVKPAVVKRVAVASKPRPATRRVSFRVNENHSTQLTPGILLGVSNADARRDRASGWLWVGRARHTIWLRNQPAHQPLRFHGSGNSHPAELMITSVKRNAVSGYLLLFGDTHD